MQTSPVIAIILSILLLMATRFIFGMTISSYQSRKAIRRYKTDVSFWNRWFFLSAPDYVRDKYDKLERKVIRARALVRTLRVMNFILHGLLVPEIAVILLSSFGAALPWGEQVFSGYIILCGSCLIILALVEWAYHPNFERMRHGRKPSNW